MITWLLPQKTEIMTKIGLTTVQLDVPAPGGTNVANTPI